MAAFKNSGSGSRQTWPVRGSCCGKPPVRYVRYPTDNHSDE
jgi:hypothetical protein